MEISKTNYQNAIKTAANLKASLSFLDKNTTHQAEIENSTLLKLRLCYNEFFNFLGCYLEETCEVNFCQLYHKNILLYAYNFELITNSELKTLLSATYDVIMISTANYLDQKNEILKKASKYQETIENILNRIKT